MDSGRRLEGIHIVNTWLLDNERVWLEQKQARADAEVASVACYGFAIVEPVATKPANCGTVHAIDLT